MNRDEENQVNKGFVFRNVILRESDLMNGFLWLNRERITTVLLIELILARQSEMEVEGSGKQGGQSDESLQYYDV